MARQVLRLPPIGGNTVDHLNRHVTEINRRFDTISQTLADLPRSLKLEGDFDAGGFRITNLGEPESDLDSVSIVHLQDVINDLDDQFLASVTSEGEEEGVGGPGRLFRRGTSRFRRLTDDAIQQSLIDALPTAAPPNVAAVSFIGTTFDPPHFSLQDHTHGGVIGSPPAGGVAGQVAFFTSTFEIGGDPGLTYDSTTNILSIGETNVLTIDGDNATLIGSATPGTSLHILSEAGTGGLHFDKNAFGKTRLLSGEQVDPFDSFVPGGIFDFGVVSEGGIGTLFGGFHAGDSGSVAFFGVSARGTLAAPTASLDEDTLFKISAFGFDADDVLAPNEVGSIFITAKPPGGVPVSGFVSGQMVFTTTDMTGTSANRIEIHDDGSVTFSPVGTSFAISPVGDAQLSLLTTASEPTPVIGVPKVWFNSDTSTFRGHVGSVKATFLTDDGNGVWTLFGGTSSELRFETPNEAAYTSFAAQNQTADANIAYTLPAQIASAGEVLMDLLGDGVLSWESVSAGGGVTGTGAADQVAFFTSASNITSNADLGWDGTTFSVTGDATITGKLTVGGAIDPTMVLLTGGNKRFGATDAGPVYLAPFTDAVAGVQVRKADNTTVVLNVDTTNSFVGIGTAAPNVGLHFLATTTDPASGKFEVYSNTANNQGRFAFVRGRGTIATPAALQTDDILSTISVNGHDGTAITSVVAEIRTFAAENYTTSAHGARMEFLTTALGATSRTIRMKLGPDGFLGLGNNITALEQLDVSGNIQLKAIGNKLRIKEGTNASMGVATLVGGTVVVNNTIVTANSRIFYSVQAPGGVQGFLSVARTAATSFTFTSTNVLDTSTIAWHIIEPAP